MGEDTSYLKGQWTPMEGIDEVVSVQLSMAEVLLLARAVSQYVEGLKDQPRTPQRDADLLVAYAFVLRMLPLTQITREANKRIQAQKNRLS